jgi:hypothetical protein
MKKYIIFLTIAMASLSIFYLQSCKEEDPLVTTGSIMGVITDADSKQPLKGASVSIEPGGSAKVTGNDGAYSFDQLDAQEYTLTYTKEDYIAASKKITVKQNMNTSVDVALEPIKPQLKVSSEKLDFGAELSTLPLDISNEGKGSLLWTISYDSTWFVCTPEAGTAINNITPVVVSVSRAGKERGSYTQVFTISSNGGSKVITVSMEVSGIALEIEPQTLNFGSLTSSLQLSLGNKGTGNIDYTVETSNAWISLSKKSGTISKNDYVTVLVSRESLSPGNYTGAITLKSGIESFVIPVIMEISVEEKPVIGFDQIKTIAYNSAVFGGTMISVGSAKVTRYGFCWNTSPSPTVDDNKTNLGDCSNPLAFESTATNLQHSTQYYVRAYAENSVGLSYSSERSFTTADLPTVPSVITGNASEITASSAKIGATLSSLGNEAEVTQHGHVWSLNSNPGIDLTTRTNLGTLSVTGQYTSSLTGLSPNKEYHVRAYAVNSKGTAYGNEITFTTATADIALTTNAATDIVHNAATCGGTITSDGGHTIVERGVCWATTASPTTNDHPVVSSSSGSTFTCRITDLATTTTYHVRAYVKTQSGATYYGENKTFTTTQVVSLPAVAATTISNIGTDKATFQSSVTNNGNSTITDGGFVYAAWQNPTLEAAEKLSCGAGLTSFGKTATALSEGTTYYVRAYATNAMGTAYGTETSFSTSAITVPALAAVQVSNIGISSATLNSAVTGNGNAVLTESGFCWSENSFPTVSDNKVSCGTNTALSANLTNLNDGTTYYVRAYAINSKGTGYSAEATFTTITLPSNVIFVSATQGNDNNSGRSWNNAKKTISAAMSAANTGEQVWVTNATYQENVTIKEGVNLYGGFAGTEISVSQRTTGNRTILLRNRFIQSTAFSTSTIIDGFEVSTVSSAINFPGGCKFNNLAINACTNTIEISGCEINNFTLNNNTTTNIQLTDCIINEATVSGNKTITLSETTMKSVTASNNTVSLTVLANATIENGVILASPVSLNGGSLINCKITSSGTLVEILTNGGNIIGCLVVNTRYNNINIAISSTSGNVNIYNCTIILPYSEYSFYGCVEARGTGDINIVNSILRQARGAAFIKSSYAGSVYASNTIASNYTFTTGRGNISLTNNDAFMLDANYVPQSDSPAINAGDNSFVSTSKDVNGNTRIQGGTVDIGAIETSY